MRKLSKIVTIKQHVKTKTQISLPKELRDLIREDKDFSINQNFQQKSRNRTSSNNNHKDEQIKYIQTNLNQLFSHILIFSGNKTEIQTKIKRIHNIISKKQMSRNQIVQLLDKNLFSSLCRFSKTISCIKSTKVPDNLQNREQIQKINRNKERFQGEIRSRIKLCVQSITELIQRLNQQHPWCQCSRKICSVRYDSSYTQKAMNQFIFSEINQQKIKQGMQFIFFNLVDDIQCDIISLKNIDNSNLSKKEKSKLENQIKSSDDYETTIKFINNICIPSQSQRISCLYFGQQECNVMIQSFCDKQ